MNIKNTENTTVIKYDFSFRNSSNCNATLERILKNSLPLPIDDSRFKKIERYRYLQNIKINDILVIKVGDAPNNQAPKFKDSYAFKVCKANSNALDATCGYGTLNILFGNEVCEISFDSRCGDRILDRYISIEEVWRKNDIQI